MCVGVSFEISFNFRYTSSSWNSLTRLKDTNDPSKWLWSEG